MSSTLTLTPREKQTRRYATRLALIATLGPFFYGFEGMVLNAAIKAVGTTSSWGPIFSIVMGEMFPNSIRGGAMSLASGADFLVNFLVVLLFPFLIGWSPAGTYWIYCAFGVLAVIFTAKFLTETSGAELEDMDKVVTQK